MSEMGYWFVSHCSKDSKVVEQIVDVLKDCGISYWKAPEMIPTGSNYAREIPMALKNCNMFLFIVSEASQKSIWVEKELDSAINARKNIIPVRIDNTPLSDMYAFYMNNIQMIDIKVQPDGRIEKESLEILQNKFKNSLPKQNMASESRQKITKVRISADMTENADVQNEMERWRMDARKNALRINKIPIFCDQCGMKLEQVHAGTYNCPACNIEYYDDMTKIRNFIRENGPAPAYLIARKTGVSKQAIEYCFRDDMEVSLTKLDFEKSSEPKIETKITKDNEGKWHTATWKK